MKRYCLMVWMLAAAAAASAQGRDISLDGPWAFSTDDSVWQQVVVPHTYNVMPRMEEHAGWAVYQRTLPPLPAPDKRGQTVRLHFGGVYHDAVVFVNGQRAGEHLNKGYTPFSVDITRFVRAGGDNLLRVECRNDYTELSLPYRRSFDWNNDGGIYRSVWLHVSGRHALRYVHATPSTDGTVRFDIRLHDDRTAAIGGRLTVTCRTTGEVVHDADVKLKKRKTDRHFSTSIRIDNPLLWHFDHPHLYDFTFAIPGSDELSDHFGFREFAVGGRTFLLNGEKVRLPGIEDMPGSNPLYGMAEPRSYMEQTVRMMKELNTTITRFHWVQDEARLDLMDELGLLVQEELSWWQLPQGELSPALRQTAREALEEMIEAHYNHPCIFGWGLSNEVGDNVEELQGLAAVVRSLDGTRLVDAICNNTGTELASNPSLSLDLPTWNEYTGTWNGQTREELPALLDSIDSIIPDRPLFITEAGLCEPAFVGGDSRRVDDMLYHIREWQRCPFVCGYIYFCLQDYRTQMGEEGRGKHRIRRHGVCRNDLTPKASYHILRQLMSPVEIVEVKPDHVVLAVKNTIPSYALRGYRIRYTDRDGAERTLALPDLQPGERHTLTLEHAGDKYGFQVVRPNGFVTIEY